MTEARLPGQDLIDQQVIEKVGDEWRLVGSRCSRCGHVYYPPRELCVLDLADCTTVPLSQEGSLYAAACVEIAPEGFDAPYWVGYVDLPEGVRVFTRIRWTGDGDPTPEARLRLRIEVVRRTPETLGPVFTGP